jgi:GDP-mannose 6-dehydrogenase
VVVVDHADRAPGGDGLNGIERENATVHTKVFGLGNVGAMTTAALADDGHHITSIDDNPVQVEMVSAGRRPVTEAGLSELMAAGVAAGRIRAIGDAEEGVRSADISMVRVGTPSRADLDLDLGQTVRICGDIGVHLGVARAGQRRRHSQHQVAGSTRDAVVPALERASGLKAGRDFGVCVNPEFVCDKCSIQDFRKPPFTLLGIDDEISRSPMVGLYKRLDADQVVAPIRVAEMVKYTCSAFHAVKVAFANEIRAICKQHEIGSHRVINTFGRDTNLNISAAYLKPALTFGGSCLPRDLRALTYKARRAGRRGPIARVGAAEQPSPDRPRVRSRAPHQADRAPWASASRHGRPVREPACGLIERLIGNGTRCRSTTAMCRWPTLHGANRAYIKQDCLVD